MLSILFRTLISAFQIQRCLALENLALRQQIAVLQHSAKRPRLRPQDRLFWTILSRIWAGWREPLVIVKPATVVRWHRGAFRLYWRWKSRPDGTGRPAVPLEIRDLIRKMSRTNPLWGAPRIHGDSASWESTSPRPRSQST